jgi:uncharacterized membrane protein HdeD (DUF308 family)
MESRNVSTGYRVLEIILGIFAIGISVYTLIYPAAAAVSLVFVFGIALLVVGILRIGTGAFSGGIPDSARSANVVIGVLAVIVGALVLVYPGIATVTLILLLAIALLVYGLGRVAFGGLAGNLSGGLRALLVIMGILMIIFAALVMIYPSIGVVTLGLFISLAFLFIGIDSLAAGIGG